MTYRIKILTIVHVFILLTLSTDDVRGFQITPEWQKAQLVFDDLHNFSRAYGLIQNGADPVKTLKEEYFGHASQGLRAYSLRKDLSPESLAEKIRKYPKFYGSLKHVWAKPLEQERNIREALKGFKKIYPKVLYPPTYFFIGDMSAGGLADMSGLLIPAETYSFSPKTNTSEFSHKDFIPNSVSEIPHLVAHELTHFQQAAIQGVEKYRAIYGDEKSLLALSVREGSADFVAELASGGHINAKAHNFGLKNEKELWGKFRVQMLDKDTGDWLFIKPAEPEKPQDLGYFIGYKIAESYYKNAADKEKAILEILSVTDYATFLNKSGYDEKFQITEDP